MIRITILLLMALTIHVATLAQPSKGKKKGTAAKATHAAKKTVQEREEEGQTSIALAKAVSAFERTVKEMQLSFALDSTASEQSTLDDKTPYKPYGWVNDFTHLFTLAQQTELDSLITAFEKATTVEIAIVTIAGTATSKGDFDNYINALGNRWGVGKQETNNGVVIGICPSYKRIRISTGTGIQQQLTDQETKALIDNIIIPQYNQGRYFEGTRLGLLAVMRELTPSH